MSAVMEKEETDLMKVFDKEVLDFLARRYSTSINGIVGQFLKQSDIEKEDHTEYGFTLETNEVEILRDYYILGLPVT